MNFLKLLDWTDREPKNKFLRYAVFYPAFFGLGIIGLVLVIFILPELIAWAFGFSCLIWAVYWPCSKIYDFIKERRRGRY